MAKEKEDYKTIPAKSNTDEVWCLWTLDQDTQQVHYLACNDKEVITSLVKKKNSDLKENSISKGPYLWNRGWNYMSVEEFNQLNAKSKKR